MPAYYPVFLNVRGRRCVVIGGERVGEEKAIRLMEHGADVVVISPVVTDTVQRLEQEGRLTWERRLYCSGDLEGAFIAIVADTGNARLNGTVSEEARERNVALNVVDVPQLCTWIAPAIARRGEVTVAVSTGGASPALARRIRDQVECTTRMKSRYGVMEMADLAPLLTEARRELSRQRVRLHGDHWQACLTDDLVDLVRDGRTEEAMALLMPRLLEGHRCDCDPGECRMWQEVLAPPENPTGRAASSSQRGGP